MEKTTITLSKDTKARLATLKTHPRQGYEEVVVKLLDEHDKAHQEEVNG
ncbi:MAG: hypothetical protein PHP55_10075 [Methanoculleus sp.]|nr:hypothetical protein [Methanoculleus sp.]